MISTNRQTFADNPRKIFLLGVLLGLALVLLGWWLVPTASLLSVGAAGLILIIYGLLGYFAVPRLGSSALRLVELSGLLAGAIFAGEILLEYVFLPQDNTSWGWLEFGSVFAVYFLTAVVIAHRARSLRQGLLGGLGTAMLSSLIWLIVALLMFYLFRGSARQVQVLIAEGDYADFARSGAQDFNTFVMEDLFGAGFYHLLLGPFAAALLGTLGGLLGKGLARIRKAQPGPK